MSFHDLSNGNLELRRVALSLFLELALFRMMDGVPKPAVHRDTVVHVHLKLAKHDGDEAENSQSSKRAKDSSVSYPPTPVPPIRSNTSHGFTVGRPEFSRLALSWENNSLRTWSVESPLIPPPPVYVSAWVEENDGTSSMLQHKVCKHTKREHTETFLF
jgi:hypothetical protein